MIYNFRMVLNIKTKTEYEGLIAFIIIKLSANSSLNKKQNHYFRNKFSDNYYLLTIQTHIIHIISNITNY